MRKLMTLVASLTLLVGAAAFAGDKCSDCDKEKGGKGHKGHMEKMAKCLDLTAEQQEQVKAIHEKYCEQMKAADKDAKKVVREQMIAEISAILTPEQQEKFAAKRKEHKGKGKCDGDCDKEGKDCDCDKEGKGKCDGDCDKEGKGCGKEGKGKGKCKGKGKGEGCEDCE